ncbi:MAG: hypothetical protein WC455_11795 [Dehalococcoidia bacterium]|jgi:hypothetical protein
MKRWIVHDSKTLVTVACETLKEARVICREFNKHRHPNDRAGETLAIIEPIDGYLYSLMRNVDLISIPEHLPKTYNGLEVWPGGETVVECHA